MKNKISLTNTYILFITLLVLLSAGMYFSIVFMRSSPYFHASFYKNYSLYNYYKNELSALSIEKSNARAASVPVLLYHGITDSKDRFTFTLDGFRDQIFALKRAGYQTITLQQFEDYIHGKIELPEKSFLLTFDDGRKDSYYGADPVLKATGFSAVMFTATGKSLTETAYKSTYYLDPKELAEMETSGRWDIESHFVQQESGFVKIDSEGTLGNFLSNKKFLPEKNRVENDAEYTARVALEASQSKKDIETALGKKVIAASYPFGDFGQQSINSASSTKIIYKNIQANYEMAFRQVWPKPGAGYGDSYSYNYPYDNTYMLRRMEPSPEWSGAELIQIMDIGSAKTLPYVTPGNLSENGSWINAWGELGFTSPNSKMTLKASSGTEGSFAYLDGSYIWADYVFTTNVNWKKGAFFSLVSRYVDDNNYVSCTYNAETIKIEEKINGVSKIVINRRHNLIIPSTTVQLAMVSQGKKIGCYIGSTKVAEEDVDTGSKLQGGVALKTWDTKINNTFVDVLTADIYPISNGVAKYLSFAPTYEVKKGVEKHVVEDIHTGMTSASQDTTPAPVVDAEPIPFISLFAEDGTPTPYKAFLVNLNGWKNLFGTVYSENNTLYFGSNASTTSSMAILRGSEYWKDYIFTTVSNWNKGSSYSLVARYKDPNNYVGCSFSIYGSSVRLFEVRDGETYTLSQSPALPYPAVASWENNNLAISVQGDEVKCYKDGEWALRANIETMAPIGGIGIKTWDKLYDHAIIGVTKMTVEPLSN